MSATPSPTRSDFKPASAFVPMDHDPGSRSPPKSGRTRRLGSAPSCQAVRGAVSKLYRIDDFGLEKIGAGFFSEVFKVTHKSTGKIMVLKMNKHRSNRNNMLKEVQLLNKLSHPNILRFEAACVHEGQLHALTEYVNGGSLEQLIQLRDEDLPWSLRISLALDMAKGIAYLHSKGYFHRDLTSKNILVRRNSLGSLTAIVADFGLANKIPNPTDFRLPQVGSPYWMSPECLRGKFYDEKADIFSFGIILCELIGRLDADPDVLPRTENFGVDYIAFSARCPSCPPDFLKLAYSCVRIDPKGRPTAKELISELDVLLDSQRKVEARQQFEGKFMLRLAGHNRSFSSDPDDLLLPLCSSRRSTPSEKARFHFRPHTSVMSVGHEMSLRDPHYKPSLQNPFATLPRLREGRKLLGSSKDLFSSCFELPSPSRATTPIICSSTEGADEEQLLRAVAESIGSSRKKARTSVSLPSSPISGNSRRSSLETESDLASLWEQNRQFMAPLKSTAPPAASTGARSCRYLRPSASTSKFEDHLFQGRVQLLKRLYSGGGWMTQDDSAVEMMTNASKPPPVQLRRRGSCESGFYSVGTDDIFLESGMSSTRSLGSSLLTVSDLEEDLRAASAFLSHQRTSSVFTDSNDDLASLANLDIEPDSVLRRVSMEKTVGGTSNETSKAYEKDIRDIVDYFETSCRLVDHRRSQKSAMVRSGVAPRAFRKYVWQGQPETGAVGGSPITESSHSRELPRSQKIDSLIKRVVEKESRDRFRTKSGFVAAMASANFAANTQRMQICDGIVRSKLPLFDHTKCPQRSLMPYSQKGFVKSKMALFDQPPMNPVPSSKQVAEMKLAAIVSQHKANEEGVGNKLSKNAT